MGGAVKALAFLSAPLPLLCSRRSSTFVYLSAAAFSSYRRVSNAPRRSSCSVRSIRQLQTPTVSGESPVHDSLNSLHEDVDFAWPEWTRLVRWLTDENYVDRALTASDALLEDEFEERRDLALAEEFVRVGKALMLFARENPDLLRSLSKKEIGIVVNSVSPYLFKDGENSMKRLTNFLNASNNDMLQPEKAETIDLVRFLLSYASKFEKNSTNVVSDASVKNLLVELITLSGTTRLPNLTDPSERPPFLQQEDQSSGPPGQTISRKAGDWFCSKCNFMNFARNTKCLECSEPKPKRILTGKEWECPQCSFFNYGRNMSCLRCDCKRIAEIPLPTPSPSKNSTLEDILNKSTIEISSNTPHTIKTSGNGYIPIKDSAVSQTVDRLLSREPSKTSWESLANQRQEKGHVPFNPLPADMFAKSKATKIEVKSSSSEEEFPRMMPVRNGENRFVVSRKKDRSLTTPQYKRRIAMEQANNSNADFVPFVPFPPDYFAKKRENKLPEMRHGSEKTQETSTNGLDPNSSHDISYSSQERSRSEYSNRQEPTNSNFGHFVSFPPEYSAKKRVNKLSETEQVNEKTEDINTRNIKTSSLYETYESEQQRNKPEYSGHPDSNSNSQKISNSQSEVGDVNGSYSTQAHHSSGYNDNESYPKTSSSSSKVTWNKTLEGSSMKESNSLDMSEEAKAERWFKRAAQIKDISELENIPDEDFPEIMPMRKGVNRFVVSKRKTPLERRLTSSQYRRNLPSIKSDPEKDKGFSFDRS